MDSRIFTGVSEMKDTEITSFLTGAAVGLAFAFLLDNKAVSHHAAGPGAVINSSKTQKTSTGDPRVTYAAVDTVAPGLAAMFVGGNTATTGPIGTTGLQHGPANRIPYPCGKGQTGVDGKPAQNGYCIASHVWNPQVFCGATSVADAKNRVGLALARYIAGKLQHPTNFYETPQFIAAVQQAYPTYVDNIASHLFPTCQFKDFGATIPSDHTQKDGVFDPIKQIGDDMLHFGCLGQPGIAEYGNEAIPGDPQNCTGESAVPPTSPYHTS
jgi:hypothetical protein